MAIALVGTVGAVSSATGPSTLTPAWGTGESRTAGNLLICVADVSGGISALTISAGWTLAVQAFSDQTHAGTLIFYKVATGSDAAPTLTPSGTNFVRAALSEWSGTNPIQTSVLDQVGAVSSLTSASVTATAGGPDVRGGDLVIYAGALYVSSSTATTSHTVNNGTYVGPTGWDNDSTAAARHYRYGYEITTGNSAADNDTFAGTGVSGMFGTPLAIASFTAASVPGTINYPQELDDSVALIDAGNNLSTTLASNIAIAATTIPLTSATGFPTSGTISIFDPVAGNEICYYNGVSGNTLQNVLKGREGTSDLAHTAANVTSIEEKITARHHTVLRDSIVAIQKTLGRVPYGKVSARWNNMGFFNVQDYGAVPDGTTDSTTSFQNAINDCANAGGGIVWVPAPPLTPFLISQIKMKSNVWLMGEGAGSTLQTIAGNSNSYLVVLNSNAETDCRITDLGFVGDITQAVGAIDLENNVGIAGDYRHRLENLYIHDFGLEGLKLTSRSCFLYGLYLNRCGRNTSTPANGITFGAGSDHHCVALEVLSSGLAGIYDNGDYDRFEICRGDFSGQVTAASGDGWHFPLAANQTQLYNCSAQANPNAGFYMANAWFQVDGAYSDGNAIPFYFNGAQFGRFRGHADKINTGAVTATSLVTFSGSCTDLDIEIDWDASGAHQVLPAGVPVISGTYSNSRVNVKNTGADMRAETIFDRRSDTYGAMVLPQSADYGKWERLVIGASSSLEIPSTSTLTIGSTAY